MRLSTKKCHTVGQLEIAFEIAPEAAPLAKWLIEYFEFQALSGTRFEDNQTVELGWSLLQLRRSADILEVWEPDFDSMPIRWCSGVNISVRHLSLQQSACDLFCCEPQFSSLMCAGIVSPMFFESKEYVMSRDTPSNMDSGWVFTEPGYSGADGEFRSLYEIALHNIAIVPFLALPPLSHIRIQPCSIEVTVNNTTKSSDKCEFLRNCY
jgi:hypothetical protein